MRAREGTAAPVLRRPAGVRVRRRFDAPADRVFAAWLDPHLARRWLFATATRPVHDADIDARVDGTFRFVDRHGGVAEYRGRYTALERPRRIAFSLAHGEDAASHVTIDIVAQARGCELVLTHAAVPRGNAHAVRDRWTGIMYGLAELLDDEGSNHRSDS